MQFIRSKNQAYIQWAIFLSALLIYLSFPSNNDSYAEDELDFARKITRTDKLVSIHHLFLNVLSKVYFFIKDSIDDTINPLVVLKSSSVVLGAFGLLYLYKLSKFLNLDKLAIYAVLICGFSSGWWSYALAGDVYVPATALLIIGSYYYYLSVYSTKQLNANIWMSYAIVAFVLMIMQHQAYAVYVFGISLGMVFINSVALKQRLLRVGVVFSLTALLSLLIYWLVYLHFSKFSDFHNFTRYIQGFAVEGGQYDSDPELKMSLLSIATYRNGFSGLVRAVFPYYILFWNDAAAHAIQNIFPQRNIYFYPYLVHGLSLAEVIAIMSSIVIAGFSGSWLLINGFYNIITRRDKTAVLVIALLPQAIFFLWWQGMSDEFWIWSLPILAIIIVKGLGKLKIYPYLLYATVAGMGISTFFGGILLFTDPYKDVDYANQSYIYQVKENDLVIAVDIIQSSARAALLMQKTNFEYINIMGIHKWNESEYASLDGSINKALASGGKIYVDPYVVHPPISRVYLIKTTQTPDYEAVRQKIIERLQLVPTDRIIWADLVASTPGFFVE